MQSLGTTDRPNPRHEEKIMNIDRAVMALAGTLTLVGTILAVTLSPCRHGGCC